MKINTFRLQFQKVMKNNCQVCHKSKIKTHLNSFGQGDQNYWVESFSKIKSKTKATKRSNFKIEHFFSI